jgi:hypothetical protein
MDNPIDRWPEWDNIERWRRTKDKTNNKKSYNVIYIN